MDKKFYRNIEDVLRGIDASRSAEDMLRETLRQIVAVCAEQYGIESGRLYREQDDQFTLIESVGEYGESITGLTVSRDYPVVQDLLQRRLVMISPDSPGFDPEIEYRFSHFNYAAVLVGEAPAYILSFGIRRGGGDDDGDLHFILETIRTAVGLKLRQSSLENQLRQAQQIQQSLLPRRLPELPGFDLAALSIPAEEVGGDVYDAQEVEAGVLCLSIADASGHGLPAALQARDVVTGLRMGMTEEHKISTTVQKLNRVIHQSGLVSRFVSLFYGELEETGSLSFVNGGHCPPLLFSTAGEVFELPSNGPVLGPLPDATYRRSFANIHPGEVLVMFTDGLIERKRRDPDADPPDVEEYGVGRVIATVQAHLHRDAAEIVAALIESVRVFGSNASWEDDVTVFVVRRLTKREYSPKSVLDAVSRRTSPLQQVGD
ncbi:MAG: PP2C family protein-serine/threonine phosphatase [bacterium]|nr:PP2C family protein-serine/threonine phosphatase [bacterium]